MKNLYLITGAPGSGKSSLTEELRKKGYSAFDLDDFAHWEHKETKIKAPVDSECTEEFLATHVWITKWEIIENHLSNFRTQNPIIFLGITSNMEDLLPHFDKIFLLQCTEQTILTRLQTRATSNFGKTKIEQDNVMSWFKDFEGRMIELGAIAIVNDGDITSTTTKLIQLLGNNQNMATIPIHPQPE